MPELNIPACPTHGVFPRAIHPENFRGAVDAIVDIIESVSGVGTISYSRCPYGYEASFNGLVRALEDLNTTVSGISTQATAVVSGLVAGSGIYITPSGGSSVINVGAAGQGSVSVIYSGNYLTISGQESTSTIVSGSPGTDYQPGTLWFDTNEGRLFVYASGGAVDRPAWYQTNAEALAYKSEQPPSGAGLNAPPRDGALWFNNFLGSLFVYDAVSSGWYETSSVRTPSYGPGAPAPTAEGATWIDSTVPQLKVWTGSAWVDA